MFCFSVCWRECIFIYIITYQWGIIIDLIEQTYTIEISLNFIICSFLYFNNKKTSIKTLGLNLCYDFLLSLENPFLSQVWLLSYRWINYLPRRRKHSDTDIDISLIYLCMGHWKQLSLTSAIAPDYGLFRNFSCFVNKPLALLPVH